MSETELQRLRDEVRNTTVIDAARKLKNVMCETASLDTSYDVTEALGHLTIALAKLDGLTGTCSTCGRPSCEGTHKK